MARYKQSEAEYGQGQFLTVNLQEQLPPGTYEYMLDDIIEHIIDTSVFDLKYKNDETGASAINPKALLKLVFYGYSKDRKSSRGLWDLSQHHSESAHPRYADALDNHSGFYLRQQRSGERAVRKSAGILR